MAIIYCLWIDILLLVPNTFYMITDLIHLNQFQFNFLVGLNLTEWVCFTYLMLGVFLAIYVMILIFMEIGHLTSLMVKSYTYHCTYVLKWIRHIYRPIFKTSYGLFN